MRVCILWKIQETKSIVHRELWEDALIFVNSHLFTLLRALSMPLAFFSGPGRKRKWQQMPTCEVGNYISCHVCLTHMYKNASLHFYLVPCTLYQELFIRDICILKTSEIGKRDKPKRFNSRTMRSGRDTMTLNNKYSWCQSNKWAELVYLTTNYSFHYANVYYQLSKNLLALIAPSLYLLSLEAKDKYARIRRILLNEISFLFFSDGKPSCVLCSLTFLIRFPLYK